MATNPYTANPSSGALTLPHGVAYLPAALEPVVETARRYHDSRRSPNTIRSYESGWRNFTRWCDEHDLQALPTTPRTIVLYVTDLWPVVA